MNLFNILDSRSLTVSVTESCTGGLLSHHFTKNPGSSKYFLGGIIAYHKNVKVDILGVNPDVNVVSKECAEQMVNGLKNIIDSDIYISVTGFAGPTANPDGEVGNIYFSIIYRDTIYNFNKKYYSIDRRYNCLQIINSINDELIKLIS